MSKPRTFFSAIPLVSSCRSSDGDVAITSVSVCNIEDIVAIASTSGTISFYSSKGEKRGAFNHKVASEPVSHILKLCWKPNSDNFLVSGGADGRVTCWSTDFFSSSEEKSIIDAEKYVYTNREVHQCEINFIIWKNNTVTSCSLPEEERLVTTDVGGTICLWKIDNKALILIPVSKLEKNFKVDIIMFPLSPGDKNNHIFLYGLQNGEVQQADERGRCYTIDFQESSTAEPIDHIFCYTEKSRILIVTRSLLIVQIKLRKDGRGPATIISKAQLSVLRHKISSSTTPRSSMILTPCGHLISDMMRESHIQCWDLSNDKSYELNFARKCDGGRCDEFDRFVSLEFDKLNGILIAGMNHGRFILWKKVYNSIKDQSPSVNEASLMKENGWFMIRTCWVPGDIVSMYHSQVRNHLILKTDTTLLSMNETTLQTAFSNSVAAIQIDRSQITVFTKVEQVGVNLDTNIEIIGIYINLSLMVVWGSSEIKVYNIKSNSCELCSHLHMNVYAIALRDSTLYMAQDRLLIVAELSGVQKLKICFTEEEGQLYHLDITEKYLAILTDVGVVKIFDVSNKDPKLLSQGNFRDDISSLQLNSIMSLRCNANCTIISLLLRDEKSGFGDEYYAIYLYDIRSEKFQTLSHHIDDQFFPTSHCWDEKEPKLFACEIRSSNQNSFSPRILTLIISSDLEVHTFEDSCLDAWTSLLVGIKAPSLFFIEPRLGDSSKNVHSGKYHKKSLSEFNDLETEDPSMMFVIVNFFNYLKSGKMEEAYTCVQSLDNHILWRKLAQSCVENGCLQVAESCLSQMGNASAMAAVRRDKKEPERDAALAQVAIHFGMFDLAEKIYKQCKRFDLLCVFFRRRGLWKDALQIAKESPLTENILRFRYGTYLEQLGEVTSVLENFQKCSLKHATLKTIIKVDSQFEKHVHNENNTESLKYASYLESIGSIEAAKKLYFRTGDHLNLVKLSCLEGDNKHAFELIKGSKNPDAIYYLARHLEADGDILGATTCYTRSGMYNHVIRLLKTHDLDLELITLTIKCQLPQMLECANYFEKKKKVERICSAIYERG